VRAIVNARPGVSWKPYNLADPTTLPLCAKGIDWSDYLGQRGLKPRDCGRL